MIPRPMPACLTLFAALVWLAPSTTGAEAARRAPALTLDTVNAAKPPVRPGNARDPARLKAEILLARAGFSPGAIDGLPGDNFRKALAAFQQQNGLDASGRIDDDTWSKLSATSDRPVLMRYRITDDDVKGPFTKHIPHALEQQAHLKQLAYTGPRQLLAEKFHMQEGLLQALNPHARFTRAGTEIVVADVTPDASAPPPVGKVVVDKNARDVRVLGQDGNLIAFYPASIGSSERPAPSGTRQVRTVAFNPVYHYRPELHFKGVKARHPFTVPRGPNNPVGDVWIDLSDSYGIHGTPDPGRIGKTFSHGCIRLTNWDATALGHMVHKGTEVDFVD